MKNETLDWITDKRITAIVRGVYDESCVALARALYDGGISILEVTFDQRCPAEYRKTAETIRLLSKTLSVPSCLYFHLFQNVNRGFYHSRTNILKKIILPGIEHPLFGGYVTAKNIPTDI